MAKKRSRSSTSGGAENAAARGGDAATTTTLTVVQKHTTSQEVLHATLAALDAIAREAHEHVARQRAAGRADDAANAKAFEMFAAMAAPHYRSLATALTAFGLQMLPVVEDVVQRLTLAMTTPLLSCAECWEVAALVGLLFRGGATRLLEEVVEVVLHSPGVFMLEAACVVPEVMQPELLADGGTTTTTTTTTTEEVARKVESRLLAPDRHFYVLCVQRKLRAMADLVYALGPQLPPRAGLTSFALRFSLEVVEQGMLHFIDAKDLLRGLPSTSTSPSQSYASATMENEVGADVKALRRWRVPTAWQAACVQLLHALLNVLSPVPATITHVAMRWIREMHQRLHRGLLVQAPSSETGEEVQVPLPSAAVYAEVLAATAQLQQLIHRLHHPAVLPAYTPPQTELEQPRRKVYVPAVDVPVVVQPAAAPVISMVPRQQLAPYAASEGSALRPSVAAPPMAVAPPLTNAPTATTTTTTTASVAAPVARVAPATTATAPSSSSRPQYVEPEDNMDEIPDIDMDD